MGIVDFYASASIFSAFIQEILAIFVSVFCRGGWTISGLDLHDPRLLAIAEAERRYLESEYVEYTASNASGAAFCRSAALIVSLKLLDKFLTSVSNPSAWD